MNVTRSIATWSPVSAALAVGVALGAALGAMACDGGSSGTGAPGSVTPPGATPAPPGPSVAATGGGLSAGAGGAAAAPSTPALDATCTADGDCGTTDRQLDGDQRCCQRCGAATAGRLDWIRRLDAACVAATDWMARCAPLGCPVGVNRAVCRAGHCVLAP